jgi:hypothetical protein
MFHVSKYTEPNPPPPQRFWKVKVSRGWWVALILTIIIYAGMLFYFRSRVGSSNPGILPGYGPLSIFGFIAFFFFCLALTYPLRRRYLRWLPGRAQNWLWFHIGCGVIAVSAALLHANFDHVLYNYCMSSSCLQPEYNGPLALYALILLVVLGIAGRLLDHWYTRVIAHEASTNGVGILQNVQKKLQEQDELMERLIAGKSALFLEHYQQLKQSPYTDVPMPAFSADERTDFTRLREELLERNRLASSLARQQRAITFMHWWRKIHIALAVLAILMICFHLGSVASGKVIGILNHFHHG